MQENNWLSYYIFTKESLDNIIVDLIKPTLDWFRYNNIIKSSFFIRYWEGGSHIRLRLYPVNRDKNKSIEEKLSKNTKLYFKTINKEYKLERNIYKREIERYGGNNAIEIAEIQFDNSSFIIMQFLSENINNWSYSNAISFSIQMHLIFAKNTIKNIEESILFFNYIFNSWIGYSIRRNEHGGIEEKEINKVINFFNDSYAKQKSSIDYIVKTVWLEKYDDEILTKWSQNCYSLKKRINKNIDNIKLPEWSTYNNESKVSILHQKLFSIYNSYVHMTNNRLGIHLRDEAFIAFLITKGLNSLKN